MARWERKTLLFWCLVSRGCSRFTSNFGAGNMRKFLLSCLFSVRSVKHLRSRAGGRSRQLNFRRHRVGLSSARKGVQCWSPFLRQRCHVRRGELLNLWRRYVGLVGYEPVGVSFRHSIVGMDKIENKSVNCSGAHNRCGSCKRRAETIWTGLGKLPDRTILFLVSTVDNSSFSRVFLPVDDTRRG